MAARQGGDAGYISEWVASTAAGFGGALQLSGDNEGH